MDIKIHELNLKNESNHVLISVIVPVYNSERFLPECLESIVHQTIKNIEIIVIDDGSTDLSYDLALRYAAVDNRIKVYQIPNSGSPSKPRNIGMELARGEYVTFVDGDDKLAAEALELLYKKARLLNAEITFSVGVMFNQKEIIGPLYAEALKNDEVALPIKYRREALFLQCVWGVLYEAELLKKSKPQFNENYSLAEDQIFLITTLFLAEKIACIKEKIYFYRKDHNNKSFTTNIGKKEIETVLGVLKDIEKLFFSKAKYFFKDYREILLELKLLRIENLEYEIGNKPIYQSIMKTAEIFLPDDEEIVTNLLDDGYKFFYMSYKYEKRDIYFKLFVKYFYKKSLPIQNKFALSKIPTIDKYPFKNNKEIIPLVFAANDYYIPYFECALLSLIQKASTEYNYHIVVLERDWNTAQKKTILNRYATDNVAFSFYNMNRILSDFTFITHHFSIDVYSRLRIPSILKTYDKCVYLDCDLIINDDISKLYKIDLEGQYLGATFDFRGNSEFFKDYLVKSLGIRTNNYFNSGVLLWDLKKSRENNLEESILQTSKARDYLVVDQDILNIAFFDKVKFLDYRWNYVPNGNQVAGKNNIEQLEAWDSIGEDFSIIHFTTEEKPWLTRDRNKADYFWNIAKQTMHYEIILKRYLHHIAKNVINNE